VSRAVPLPAPRLLSRLGALVVAAGLGVGACGGEETPRGTVSAFPAPGASAAGPGTQISLRGAVSVGDVRVRGSESGAHEGELREHGDGRGVSFVPDEPFAPGERVTVRVASADVRGGRAGSFSFTVAGRPARTGFTTAPEDEFTQGSGKVQRFRSRPDLRVPGVSVQRRADGRAPGYVVLGVKGGRGQDGPMVFDDRGELVFFRPLEGTDQPADVRVQRMGGRPVLTWWEGRIGIGQGRGEGVVVDERYRELARVRMANGYATDLHEFLLTDRGTALLVAYNPVPRDLRSVGGHRRGIAIEGVIQEIDLDTGLVVFEWHSLDHVRVDESYYTVPPQPNRPWDYFHINSVSEDRDGDLLVSARHTFAVYKIDRQTGEVRWRLNGKRSDFRVPPEARFAWQHDARRARDGTITLLDNHHTASAPPPAQRVTDEPGDDEASRALALRVDERARTVEVARSLEHPRGLLADHEAGAEMLPNRNMFVGWGEEPWFSEFAPSGELVFDGRLAEGNDSYRAYRAEWTGRPAAPPAVAVADGAAWASWNGATEVASWELLAGDAEGSLQVVPGSAVRRTGFETRLPLPAGASEASGGVVAVRALDARGRELGRSRAVPVG